MPNLTLRVDSLAILSQHWIVVLLVILVTKVIYTLFYRLYIHPLAKIPGPRLAAATWLYEIYFDLYLGGQFVFEIGRLHEIYGPIIRITPDEVHVNDPDLVDVVYPGGWKKINKDPYLMRQFGIPNTAFLTIDHDVHRLRRNALNRYFSKTAVGGFEPYIRETAEKLCRRLKSYADLGPVTISTAYSSFTTDIVTEYCFARSYNFLDRDHFLPNLQAANDSLGELLPVLKQAPWLHKVMRLIPASYMLKMNPGMSAWIKVEEDCRKQVTDARAHLHDEKPSKAYYTVIDELIRGPLPEEEKRDERLFLEAVVLVSAATETTSWNLSVCTFYILNQPSTLAKLRKELQSAITDPSQLPSLATLEQLPYLTATISETLRHSYGPVSRLPRIHVKDAVQLHSVRKSFSSKAGSKEEEVDYVVPPGYPISMTSVHVHMNPHLFPNPHAFSPERWLDSEGRRRKDLDKYILSFSKGSRQCLGINLAYAELFICVAAIVLRLGDRLELFETTTEDVEIHRDVFAMRPKRESKGIRVLVR